MQEILSKLGTSVNALIAVGIALKVKLEDSPADASLLAQVEQVLTILGLSGPIEALEKPQAAAMLANIRGDLLLGVQMLCSDTAASRWAHDDTELLQAFGEVSGGFPRILRSKIGPDLNGLLDRLNSPDAKFLDVGVGVAQLAIAMVREWPSLHVLGVDPWAPSLAIGRRNVRSAGLDKQIELKEVAAETLSASNEFDLAWVPSAFIPRQSLPKIIERVGRALKPGGWLLLARPNHDDDPLATATTHLRTVMWGGSPLSPNDAIAVLEQSGLVDVRGAKLPSGAPIAVTVGRSLWLENEDKAIR